MRGRGEKTGQRERGMLGACISLYSMGRNLKFSVIKVYKRNNETLRLKKS